MKTIYPLNHRILSAFLILWLIAASGWAQKDVKLIRKGNSDYEKKNFKDAEINYRKSLDANNGSYKAMYNLGNALYKQKNYQEALKNYKNVAENKDFDAGLRSNAWHNIGNALLQSSMGSDSAAIANKQENLKSSIDAFKNALRLNPKDGDTRYNMEYAKKMLAQAQQQQQQQQQKKDNKQQSKNDQQKNQQQQNGQDKKDKSQKSPENQNKMSKQEADRMLEAMNNNEKNTRDKLKQAFSGKTKIEKDW